MHHLIVVAGQFSTIGHTHKVDQLFSRNWNYYRVGRLSCIFHSTLGTWKCIIIESTLEEGGKGSGREQGGEGGREGEEEGGRGGGGRIELYRVHCTLPSLHH